MKQITPIRRGEVISARYLGALAENQNELIRLALAPGGRPGGAPAGTVIGVPPGQAGNIDPASLPTTAAQDLAGVSGLQPTDTWREVSRVTSTVRVTNPGNPAQYVDVDRMDQVLFANGAGELMLLEFNNP